MVSLFGNFDILVRRFVGIVIIVSIAISAVQKIRQEKNRVRVHIEDKVVDRQ